MAWLKVLAYHLFGRISARMLWCPWCERLLIVNGRPWGWHFHCGIQEAAMRADVEGREAP